MMPIQADNRTGMRRAALAGFKAYRLCRHCLARARTGDTLQLEGIINPEPFTAKLSWEQAHALRWAVQVKQWEPPEDAAGKPNHDEAFGAFSFVCSLCVADFPSSYSVFERSGASTVEFRGTVADVRHVADDVRAELLRQRNERHARHQAIIDQLRGWP